MMDMARDDLILAAFAVLLGIAVVLVVRATALLEAVRVPRAVQCPMLDRAAQCVLVRDAHTGRWTGVVRCSLRHPPEGACGEQCVRLLELGADLKPRDSAGKRYASVPRRRTITQGEP